MISEPGKRLAVALSWISLILALVLSTRTIYGYVYPNVVSGAYVGLSLWIFLGAFVSGIISIVQQITMHSSDIKAIILVLAILGVIISIVAAIPPFALFVFENTLVG
jgi:hypothetical protein